MKKINLDEKEVIFLDFDGTIKQSDNIKAEIFVKIFGNKINHKEKLKIKKHHYNNLGLSRYNKIPLYMKWNDLKITKKNILKFSSKFSKLAVAKVSKSKWVLELKNL